MVEIVIGRTWTDDGGEPRLVVEDSYGDRLEVSEETAERWRKAYAEWRVIEAEIDEAFCEAARERMKHYKYHVEPVSAWFDQHHRRLAEDPSYSWPHDYVVINGVSYGVRNR